MKQKRITMKDFMEMCDQRWQMTRMCIETESWRLLGCNWKKHVEAYTDPKTGDFVIEYE